MTTKKNRLVSLKLLFLSAFRHLQKYHGIDPSLASGRVSAASPNLSTDNLAKIKSFMLVLFGDAL